ncbi:MAG: ribonuclease III family protein [Candidatus Bathyarchaeia archaeon]
MSIDEFKNILKDRELAVLGDAYVNFAYSLALTEIERKPRGVKVSDRILAEAAKKSGLKMFLPKRTGRDDVANAVEALLIYVWIKKIMTLEQAVEVLKRNINPKEGFTVLVEMAMKSLRIEPLNLTNHWT